MPATDTLAPDAAALLGRACERNTPVELRFEFPDGTTAKCRTRLLERTGEGILTDAPQHARGASRVPAQRTVRAYLSVNGARYQFDTTILRAGVRVRLNEHRQVCGMVLRTPGSIEQTQRRDSFRVPLTGQAPIHVTLSVPHRTLEGACAVDAPHYVGRLADLSTGGARLLVDVRTLQSVQRDDLYYLSFVLPDDDTHWVLLAAVRHSRLVGHDRHLQIGVKFLPWIGGALRADQARIGRFVAARQRRTLQRRTQA